MWLVWIVGFWIILSIMFHCWIALQSALEFFCIIIQRITGIQKEFNRRWDTLIQMNKLYWKPYWAPSYACTAVDIIPLGNKAPLPGFSLVARKLFCMVWVTAQKGHNNARRCELGAIVVSLFLLNFISSKNVVTLGKVVIYNDNKTALKSIFTSDVYNPL